MGLQERKLGCICRFRYVTTSVWVNGYNTRRLAEEFRPRNLASIGAIYLLLGLAKPQTLPKCSATSDRLQGRTRRTKAKRNKEKRATSKAQIPRGNSSYLTEFSRFKEGHQVIMLRHYARIASITPFCHWFDCRVWATKVFT